jgi:hypothetical protein
VAPASMLGPSVLNKFVQFPEIPNIISGPPERIASYLNEINSSMRVSAGNKSACSSPPKMRKEESPGRTRLRTEKAVIDSVRFGALILPNS